MVKVRAIARVPQLVTRETKNDLFQHFKNPDLTLHPMQKAREYKRALNAAKMERIFAKPFVKALSDHTDSVYSISRSEKYLTSLVSGSCNGEVKVWDLAKFECIRTQNAHQGFVTGLSCRGDIFLSCGRDSIIKIHSSKGVQESLQSSMSLNGVDLSWDSPEFCSCGNQGVDFWDLHRSFPITRFETLDSTLKSKFNPNQNYLIGSVSNDRAIFLADIRYSSTLQNTVLKMKSNDLAWNPRQPMYFTVANQDSNLYSFDMRNMDQPVKIYKDHQNSVTCLSFSPTGREFASGSFDRSIRIFDVRDGLSRDVYHSKRMQWIYAIEFTGDARFIISGSDDTNLRVWKAKSDTPLKELLPREKEAAQYRNKLKKAYQRVPEIRRLLKHRHLPRRMHREKQKRQIMKESKFRKEENKKIHSKPDSIDQRGERAKIVLANQ